MKEIATIYYKDSAGEIQCRTIELPKKCFGAPDEPANNLHIDKTDMAFPILKRMLDIKIAIVVPESKIK